MNLNLYGHDGQWLMVDCGVAFEGNDVVAADPAFIESQHDRLAGIIATHAHQDHIGALPALWERFRVPIYTTPFTAYILRRRFAERNLPDVPIITVASGETMEIGPFSARWMPITHSTPETHAILLQCPAATVLHTADWKIDRDPVVGEPFDEDQFAMLDAVDAVVCDSTNATTPGLSVSEKAVLGGLRQVIGQATGRVVVGCFASNVARLQSLGTIAAETGRYVCAMGRSLSLMAEAGRASGYLDQFSPVLADDMGYLPRHEVLAVASGSQGEPGAALGRLAADTHPAMNLDPGDLVIFSARTIPGNEAEIEAIVSLFRARGIEVVHADEYELPIHASGHACQEELAHLYRWVKPRIAIPVHGEPKHMDENAAIATKSGVGETLRGENGDLFVIAGEGAGHVIRGAVQAGRIKPADY